MLDQAFSTYTEWRKEEVAKYGGIPLDNPIKNLTGGGTDLEACLAVDKYLAGCEAIDREQDPESAEVYVGSWQRSLPEHVDKHQRTTVQMPRQEGGKTHELSRMAACFAASGLPVTIAMPTMTQGSRILFRRINKWLKYLERGFTGYTRVKDNDTEILYTNGGQVLALSSDEGAEKEGYTSALLIIDESHKAKMGTLAVFEPFTNRSRRAGYGRVILNGVGGHRESLIEKAKRHGYVPLHVSPEQMVAEKPELKTTFDDAKESLTAHDYRIMYECLPAMAGLHLMFPTVPRDVLPRFKGGSLSRHNGIDVGRFSDATVVASLKRFQGVFTYDIAGRLVLEDMPLPEQAKVIAKHLRLLPGVSWANGRVQDTAVETNGIGQGIWDLMTYGLPPVLPPVLPGVTGVPLDYSTKEYLADETGRMLSRGEMAVESEEIATEFEGLGFEIRWSDKTGTSYKVWDHSDDASAVLMAVHSLQRIGVAN